ncbi:MAG: S-layer family protein [Nostoc sp.]|uniref:S-layer family protein n=1 Tax=Nostoc sp. TaxID=1180 RepID=UPI002FF862C9
MTQTKIPITTTIQTYLDSTIVVSVGMGIAIAFWANCASAQITPDTTLRNNSTVKLEGNTRIIEGGTRTGDNLFHSFGEFSVPTKSTAFFNNALDIQNIIGRVTGKSVSNIDGLIRTNSIANLFLINPSGIIFGKNASLNIGGSFVASTANAIQFSNQGFFSADNPNSPALLTVNPSAFLFNQIAAAPIQNNSVAPAGLNQSGFDVFGLRVPDGRSLLLVGGNISMDGGQLNAFNGRVELGGLSGTGTVGLNVDENLLNLTFPNGLARADISLKDISILDVTGANGGDIAINAQNLDISERSFLFAGVGQGLGTNTSLAGNITLNATGVITVKQSSVIKNVVNLNAIGNGGNVNVTSESLSVADGAVLVASTFGKGNAGNVTIQASNAVVFSGEGSAAASQVIPGAVGNGGNVTIKAKSLLVSNGAALATNTFGEGNAGSVLVDAPDTVSFVGASSGARSNVAPEGIGGGGDILITTGSLSVTDGAQLIAATEGQGSAGNIIINARDAVSLNGVGDTGFSSAAFATVERGAVGKGGNITITAGSLSLSSGAQLIVSTRGQGDAGNILLQVRDQISFDGVGSNKIVSGVRSDSGDPNVPGRAVGRAGEVNIITGSLILTNGSQLSTGTFAEGNGGKVIINARNSVSLDSGSAVISRVETGALGDGGDIIITAEFFSINDAQLTASTFGQGDAGDITIAANILEATNQGNLRTSTGSGNNAGNITLKVGDRLILMGEGSGLLANTVPGSIGNGGNIFIQPRNVTALKKVTIQDSARIAVNSQGSGKSGNIQIQAENLILDNQGLISAETASNQGGDINLSLQDLLLLRRNSQISTNAGTAQAGGDGGNITINTPFIVAVPRENSNITANAFKGSGGKVTINATGIFGMTVLSREDLVRLLGTNDLTQLDLQRFPSSITAISQTSPTLNGQVTINTPGIDPSRGLIQLPSNLVDASQQIAQGCNPRGRQTASSFIATGRGGLPQSPNEPLRGQPAIAGWVDLPPQATAIADKLSTATMTKSSDRIVEAQGWIVDAKGNVILVAQSVQSSSIPSAISCSQ